MAAQPLAEQVGVGPACRALGGSRATFSRRRRSTPGRQQPRPTPARALCEAEREQVLDVLAGARFVDRAPAEVVATLLDEGRSLCAERTMYRILAADRPVRDRRNQREHPQYTKPELVATAPNPTGSWDITKLLGPTKGTCFPLYVVLDIFSRPFSEAQFKTLKYHPDFPGRFHDIAAATAFCRTFFRWYNTEHRHGGIAMLTPDDVHHHRTQSALDQRGRILQAAWTRHPERFVRGIPKPDALPEAIWINPPVTSTTGEIPQ